MTRAAAVLLASIVAAPALAQSGDPVFAGRWTWSLETLASEATGLGGAFVGTVRGAEALYWSPAALTFDTGIDVRMSMGARPGLGVVRHGERLHLGFGVRRTFSRAIHGEGLDPERGVFEVGRFSVQVDQVAVGAAIRAQRLRLGATLFAGPMQANGAWSRVTAPSTPTAAPVEVRYDYVGADEWQVGAASSALVELLGIHPMARDQARVGVAVHWPTMLRTPRYRRSRLTLPQFDGSGPSLQGLRMPATVSVGGEARLSVFSMFRSFRVAVGADWTDYDGVLDTARANERDGAAPLRFEESRPWVLGGGIEAIHSLGRVRVGMRERAGHTLVSEASPSRARRARTTFGASHDAVIAGKRLQLDLDSTSAFDDLVLSARILW